MARQESEGETIEHRLLRALDRELVIGEDWVVLQHVPAATPPPRRLPPLAPNPETATTSAPSSVTGRSKKRKRRIEQDALIADAAVPVTDSPRPLPRKVPPIFVRPKEQVVEPSIAPAATIVDTVVTLPKPIAVEAAGSLRESRAPRFVDFTVSTQMAHDHLAQWRDSLWLAPSDLGTALSSVHMEPLFVPYHCFSGVALLAQTQRKHREFVDMIATMPCCNDVAGMQPGEATIPRQAISELEPWNVKVAQTPAVAAATRAQLATLAGGMASLRIIEPLPAQSVWESFMQAELRKMISGIDGQIQSFEDVTYRTVFLPLYCAWYSHGGSSYIFLVNGQTGMTWGQRPMGLGGVARVISKFLTAAPVSSPTSVTLVPGCDLNARDKTSVYAPEHHFLLLPPSDQFLIATAVGWCEIANNGTMPVLMRGQFRSVAKFGPIVTIEPRTRLEFGFKGSWCIEILSGDAAAIGVLQCETSAGSDKGNALGMM